MQQTADYACKYCKRKFQTERVFMRHSCTQMERAAEIQTPIGTAAFALYKRWLEKQKRTAPSIETFCTSAYYTPFVKFTKWKQETGIADVDRYVELMVKHKIAPVLWRRSEAYQIYLEYMDKISDPYEQASLTVETLTALAEGLQVAPGDVFKQLQVSEVLDLVQQRRLSPWLLFCSKSFKKWISEQHESDRAAFMNAVGIGFWTEKLGQAPRIVQDLRETAEQLGI